jgi:hypothetical protein
MVPSLSQLRLLSREDRIVYRQWLRRSMLFYGAVTALLLVAALANHVITATRSNVAGDTMHTAAMSARK